MKRVLFVTYFWPPSGKASLHWPLGVIKHLPALGWQPLVLTADKDTFTHKDESLLKDIDPAVKVIKTPALEPFTIYKRFLGKAVSEPLVASEAMSRKNKNIRHRLSLWIRMNLFVPDARMGWYFGTILSAKRKLKVGRLDAVISVGPPHTTHLIGKTLSKRFAAPFIPVLIDPWVDIVYYRGFDRNKLVLAVDNFLERSVLRSAAEVVFVTKSMRDHYERKYPRISGKTNVLYWGYNEEDFSTIKVSDETNEVVLVHAGNMFGYQNPVSLWRSIKREVEHGKNIRIRFIGTVAPEVKNTVEQLGLADRTEYLGFLPYRHMLQELAKATYLLVCVTEKRHVPGKLFEYLRIGKPIIAFGDDNEEVKQILAELNAGMLFRYDEDVRVFFEGALSFKTSLTKVQAFERRAIAEGLKDILNRVTPAEEAG